MTWSSTPFHAVYRGTRIVAGMATPGHLVVDQIECVLSVMLAIFLAHVIGAQNASWAAFSGYMVMRGHVAESLLRGVLRVFGTGVGAGLAVLLVPAVRLSLPEAAISGALVGGLAIYASITARRAYAWLFVGLTFEMILLDKLQHPARALEAFAQTRLLEVAAGTAACVMVSCISTLTMRRRWPGVRLPGAKRVGWHPHAARHASQGAVAIALLFPLCNWWAIPQLAQSAVTFMAVMSVPVSRLDAGGLKPVSNRLVQRVCGCVAGSALAGLFLFAADGTPWILIAGTVVGVAIGRRIENGTTNIAYAGTQFTLAMLVALVPDSYADAAIAPAGERLLGILVGLAVLEPVLLAWHMSWPPGA